jgi:hypothetical protein
MPTDGVKLIAFLVAATVGLIALVTVMNSSVVTPSASTVAIIWLLGAGAVGLISGFTTGTSKQTGMGTEFMKFLSVGIITPMIAGAVTLLEFRKGTIETWTFEGEKMTGHSTGVSIPAGYEHFHPIWVLGGFFLMYGFFAVVGAVLGIALRKAGFDIEITRS